MRFKHEYVISRAVECAVGKALRQLPEPEGTFSALSGTVPLASVLSGASIRYRPAETVQPELQAPDFAIADAPGTPPDDFPAVPTTPVRDGASETPGTPGKPEIDYHQLAAAAAVDPTGNLLTDRPMPKQEGVSPAPARQIEPEPEQEQEDEEMPDDGVPMFQVEFPTEVLGIYDNTYILCSGSRGLILIDQHAAHERILFERLLRDARRGSASQRLLLPQMLELPRSSATLLLRNRKTFEALGFDVEPMGSNTVMLNALPLALPHTNVETLLQDMLNELLESARAKNPTEEAYIARAACKAAIKAHDNITLEGARELLKQLRSCRQGTLCPHGRPTMLTISVTEIQRRFGRK